MVNMWLQVKNRKKKQFFRKNRKGVSIMVGYVLLVVFAIILSVITYQWIKTYIPSDPLQCPNNGVSVSIKAVSYDCGSNTLYLLIKNNGRFNILGYFVHAANVSGQEVATIDLSQYFNEDVSGGQKFGNSVAFISAEQNLFKPGDEKAAIFNLIPAIGEMTSIQITPTRLQEVDNKNRFISCGNEKVEQEIYCGMDTRIEETTCIPDCTGRICGSDGCDGMCGTCPDSQSCDALGQCYSDACTPNATVCSGQECGFAVNGTCGSVSCGDCLSGESCNATGQCVSNCGNGVIDAGEKCDDGQSPPLDGDGCSSSCTIESGWTCSGEPSVCGGDTDCNSNCIISDYESGTCISPSTCDGTMPFPGNQYCGAGEGRCCCEGD